MDVEEDLDLYGTLQQVPSFVYTATTNMLTWDSVTN